MPQYNSLRLEKIRLAVLKLMSMNNMLYNRLYSNIFDVPEYEKANALYNHQVRINITYVRWNFLVISFTGYRKMAVHT